MEPISDGKKHSMYDAVLRQDWKGIESLYESDAEIQKMKVTKSEDTALHVAITQHAPQPVVKALVDSISNKTIQPVTRTLQAAIDNADWVHGVVNVANSNSQDSSCVSNLLAKIVEAINDMDTTIGAKNKQGHTPLHCAASRGSPAICKNIVDASKMCNGLISDALQLLKRSALTLTLDKLKDVGSKLRRRGDQELAGTANHDEGVAFIEKRLNLLLDESWVYAKRNEEGETPLFVAALNGYKNTFLYLHSVSRGTQEALWRRKNRDTILHCTIQRQHFDLSFIILHLYKDQNIANLWNNDEITPLQILASIPSAFKSSTRLTKWDKLLYNFIPVPALDPDANSYTIDIDNISDDAPEERYEIQGSSIRKKKEKHIWGGQIVKELLKESSKFVSGGNEISPFQDVSDVQQLEMELSAPEQNPDSVPNEEKKEVDVNAVDIMNNMKSFQDKLHDPGLKRILAAQISLFESYKEFSEEKKENPTHLLIATKFGLKDLVEQILQTFPMAILDKTPNKKRNIVLQAVLKRQPHILKLLKKHPLWVNLREAVDDEGNNALHLAAKLPEHMPWQIHGAALQMQWEVKWFEYVKGIMPPYLNTQDNKEGDNPEQIFTTTHKDLIKAANEWLKDTSSSYSVVAALTAGVTYATCSTIPGGEDNHGRPNFQGQPTFNLFAVSGLVSFCFSVTALAAFLAVYTSRMQAKDFRRSLPFLLFLGLTSFFISIVTMLVSFCAAHAYELDTSATHKVSPWYGLSLIPLVFYATAQVPLYWDLLRASIVKLPKPKYVGEDIPV